MDRDGTGATFQVGVYNGKVRSVNPNRPGSGYANGDILTLNDLDFGGNGSNGVQDIQVTVYIEGVAQVVPHILVSMILLVT